MGFKPKCPMCESKEVIPIMYGYPGYDAFLAEKRGEVVLGGCCITMEDPQWFCKNCRYAFQKAKDMEGK